MKSELAYSRNLREHGEDGNQKMDTGVYKCEHRVPTGAGIRMKSY